MLSNGAHILYMALTQNTLAAVYIALLVFVHGRQHMGYRLVFQTLYFGALTTRIQKVYDHCIHLPSSLNRLIWQLSQAIRSSSS